MKKMTFLAVLAAAACLLACKEKEDPTPGPHNDPETKDEVSVSPATVAFEGEGGTFRVAVTTNVDDYSFSGNPDWLTVAKNGKELTLTAAANTVNEARSCNITVTAGTATAGIAVSQKAGSPYPGYVVCASAKMEYGGTMLYQFLKPTEEDYGGWATLSLADEDGNSLVAWLYTDLFKSAEEVELTTGTYTKGADDYANLSLAAKKLTYMAGLIVGGDDDDDAYATGTYYVSATTGEETPLVDGAIDVSREGNRFTIKADMKDATGNEFKYVYVGEVPIDASGATYPSENERVDVAATLYGAACYYLGDVYGHGATTFRLELYSGDPEDPAITTYTFNASAVDFSEDVDLSGVYGSPTDPDDEYPIYPFTPGSIVTGEMEEVVPGFSMPVGTYVLYSFDDIILGDLYDSLSLEKQSDGTYNMSGAIMSQSGDYVMFLGITGLAIPIINPADEED